jgi:hypothetical protein
MADSSIYTEIAKAVPVVIGGLLAVGGGVIAQIVTHRLAVRREQANLRRERLESLVKALYGHQRWIEEKLQIVVFENEDHRAPAPIDEARMLQTLYFPELQEAVCAMLDAQVQMLKFIGEQHVARMRDEGAWLQNYDPQPYFEAYERSSNLVTGITLMCRQLIAGKSD